MNGTLSDSTVPSAAASVQLRRGGAKSYQVTQQEETQAGSSSRVLCDLSQSTKLVLSVVRGPIWSSAEPMQSSRSPVQGFQQQSSSFHSGCHQLAFEMGLG